MTQQEQYLIDNGFLWSENEMVYVNNELAVKITKERLSEMTMAELETWVAGLKSPGQPEKE